MERCSSHCIARLFVNLPSVCLEHCFILAQVCPRSWSYGQRADPSLAMCDIDADDVDEEEADEEQSDGTEGAGAEGQGRGRSRGKRKLRDVDAAGKKAKERGKYQKQEKGKKRCRTPSYMDNDNHSPSGKGYRLMPPTPKIQNYIIL